MARSDDNLAGLGKRGHVPKLRGDQQPAQLQIGAEEGYVLSRIDGRTTLWEICLLVPLKRDDTMRILRRLRAGGLIEIPGSTEPMPPLEALPQRQAAAPVPARAAAVAAAPSRTMEVPAGTPSRTSVAAAGMPSRTTEVPAGSPSRTSAMAAAPSRTTEVPAGSPSRTSAMAAGSAGSAARAAPAPEAPLVLELEAGQGAPAREDRGSGAPGPARTPVPSVGSVVAKRTVFEGDATGTAASLPEGRVPSRPPAAPPAGSATSPDLHDLSLFRPGAALPEVEVLRRAPGGASAFVDDTRSSSSRRSAPPRQAHRAEPSLPPRARKESPPAVVVPPEPAPAPPGEEVCELTTEQRRRVDELYEMINAADAFTLLGVEMDADKKSVNRAYFRLSKDFHPDRFFRKQLGTYRPKVAAVFQAITEARDILMDDERRARYLAGEVP